MEMTRGLLCKYLIYMYLLYCRPVNFSSVAALIAFMLSATACRSKGQFSEVSEANDLKRGATEQPCLVTLAPSVRTSDLSTLKVLLVSKVKNSSD